MLAALAAIALGLLATFGLVTVLVATCAFAFAPLVERSHASSMRRTAPTQEVSR